jgi:hypothetical protein
VNRPTRLFLALSVALYLSTSILAQGESAVFRQIEGAMKEKAPTWKLVHRLVSKNGKYVSYQWKSGKASLGVLIFVHDTDEQASKTYHNFDLEAFGLKRKVLEGTVLDLGTIFPILKSIRKNGKMRAMYGLVILPLNLFRSG